MLANSRHLLTGVPFLQAQLWWIVLEPSSHMASSSSDTLAPDGAHYAFGTLLAVGAVWSDDDIPKDFNTWAKE